MKTLAWVFALGALGASAAATANDSMSLTQFTPHFEPVLVQVDAHGKVVSASPAYSLPPRLTRLLHANIAEMIRGPAIDKHGKPIASQFVLNLALDATPTEAGEYTTSFRYVSTQPVPMGNWFWSHEDGHRLALVNRDELQHRQLRRVHRFNQWLNWTPPQPPPRTMPATAVRTATPMPPTPPPVSALPVH